MKIVIDLQSNQSGSRLGGIGRYSFELTKALITNYSDVHDFWILLNSSYSSLDNQIRDDFANILPVDRIVNFQNFSDIAYSKRYKSKIELSEILREDFINLINPDILLITSFIEGLNEDVVGSVGRIFPADRTVMIWYDLIPYVQADKYLSSKVAYSYYMHKIKQVKEAAGLLAISDFTRSEVVSLLDINSNKVVNISSAADSKFSTIDIPEDQIKRIKKTYKIKNKFLMYTGSFDSRKNHKGLIKAYSLIPKNIRTQYQLVIVGNGSDNIYKELKDVGKNAGLNDDEIIFAGRVLDADLVPLYRMCSLFVFPSLWEGFGLPVLEAMSCGIPVIGSNTTSIPEVLGLEDALFDPNSVDDMANLMIKCLTNSKFSEKLVKHGLEQAKKFSWDASADKAVELFKAIEKSAKPKDSTDVSPNVIQHIKKYKEKFNAVNDFNKLDGKIIESLTLKFLSNYDYLNINGLPKLGWVSTWNTRCGIAEYSAHLLKEFQSNNITIFAPESNDILNVDGENVIRCWNQGGGALNNLNLEIEKNQIEALVIQFNYGFFDFVELRNLLISLFAKGINVYLFFHATQDPSKDKKIAQLAPFLSECSALLCHNMKDVERLNDLGLYDNVYLIPLGMADVNSVDVEFNKQNKFVIASYGFALPSKGLEQLVDAFIEIKNRYSNINFHLLMVNAEYPDPISSVLIHKLKTKIYENSLENNVTFITDFLADEISLGYLEKADVIVYPYQKTGESASAAVRLGLLADAPVVVTPSAIFDDLGDSVFRCSGFNYIDVANGIEKFLPMKPFTEIKTSLEKNRKLWCKAHSYKAISRVIERTISKIDTNEDKLKFPVEYDVAMNKGLTFEAASTDLRTICGTRENGKIVAEHKGGNLLHGPYVSISQGNYLLSIYGKIVSGEQSYPFVKILAQGGAVELGLEKMNNNDDLLCAIPFEVGENGFMDVEVQINIDDGFNGFISCVDFKPLS